MDIKRTLTVLVVTAFAQNSFSGTMGPVSPPWTQVITLSLGPAWTDSGETNTFFLQPDVEKKYTANENTSTLFDGEVFYGLQHALNASFTGQLGLAVAATTNAKLKGDVWEDADPEFDNFFYTYKINHTHIAAKGKLIGNFNVLVNPYLSGSLGVGFNRAHDFTITPKIVEEVPAPEFTSNTHTAFSYTVGVGVQKEFYSRWQFGIGYEFADWGKSNLGRAPGQTLNNGLSLNHLYTNELQFSLSLII
ncbi:outer membrane protein [Legionella steigerwaltii]|nr:outer membrane beta-barrel protein [Legionella steigerwaltii]